MRVSPGAPILLLERDAARAEELARQLMADGYAVELARTNEHARILAGLTAPRLALLCDRGPPRQALALLREMRARSGAERARGPRRGCWDPALPTIVLAHEATELEMLRAFEEGADDVLPGAVGYSELRARLAAVLRRADGSLEPAVRLAVGDLQIDIRAHVASVAGRAVHLRPLEFALLVHLAREPARVFSRGELLRSVWGFRAGGSTRTVDSHASRLRGKLGDGWVVGVRGVGYRLL